MAGLFAGLEVGQPGEKPPPPAPSGFSFIGSSSPAVEEPGDHALAPPASGGLPGLFGGLSFGGAADSGEAGGSSSAFGGASSAFNFMNSAPPAAGDATQPASLGGGPSFSAGPAASAFSFMGGAAEPASQPPPPPPPSGPVEWTTESRPKTRTRKAVLPGHAGMVAATGAPAASPPMPNGVDAHEAPPPPSADVFGGLQTKGPTSTPPPEPTPPAPPPPPLAGSDDRPSSPAQSSVETSRRPAPQAEEQREAVWSAARNAGGGVFEGLQTPAPPPPPPPAEDKPKASVAAVSSAAPAPAASFSPPARAPVTQAAPAAPESPADKLAKAFNIDCVRQWVEERTKANADEQRDLLKRRAACVSAAQRTAEEVAALRERLAATEVDQNTLCEQEKFEEAGALDPTIQAPDGVSTVWGGVLSGLQVGARGGFGGGGGVLRRGLVGSSFRRT